MKFPTPEPLFQSLTPSPEACRRYELLARAIVQDTLADYDQYVHEHQRQVSKQRWKPVKSRENIAVYKARDHNPQDNIHRGLASGLGASSVATPALLEHFPAVEYNLPKLLMVGTISGSLDDVMYGLSTHDTSSILLKAAYTQDEIVDGQILYQFEGPSPAKPYKFLGIKWVVKGNPLAVSAIVSPRDLLFLNTIGTRTRTDAQGQGAERYGYVLIHSVELPEVPSIYKQHGIIRGRLSTCYIFKQLRDGVVEVYMKGYIEPSGKLVESVAINSAVTGLLFCWKAVVCSQLKKIVWLLSQKKEKKGSRTTVVHGSFSSSVPAPECQLCHRSLKVFNSSIKCEVCELAVCSRCRVALKLCFETVGAKQIEQRTVVVCKSCITRAHTMNTFQVAQEEVQSGRFGLSFSTASERSSGGWDPYRKTSVASAISIATTDTPILTTRSKTISIAGTAKTFPYSEGSIGTTSMEDVDVAVEQALDKALDDWDARSSVVDVAGAGATGAGGSSNSSSSRTPSGEDWSPEKQALWQRMAQLKVQVDGVYEIARSNLNAVGVQAPPPPHALKLTQAGQPSEAFMRESID